MRKYAIILFVFIFLGLSAACGKQEKEVANSNDNPAKPEALRPLASFEGEIIFQSDIDGDHEIYLLAHGRVKKLTDNHWNDEFPRWSPDGRKIAYWSNPGGLYELYLMEADGSSATALTSDAGSEISYAGLTWFPDGNRIAYTVEKKRLLQRDHVTWEIDIRTKKTTRFLPQYREILATPNFSPAEPLLGFTGKRTIGWDVALYDLDSGKVTFVTEGGDACRPQFSKDGSKIAYVSSAADGKGDIWICNRDGSGKIRLTERDETFDYYPSWSPDGKWIAFCSSTEHYPFEGTWSLLLANVNTKKVDLLIQSSKKDLFPDWR